MSPWMWVIALFVSALLGAGVFFLLVLFVMPEALQRKPKPTTPPIADTEAVVENGARVFDPNNPPHYAVYNPKVYDQTKAPRCTCHNRPLDQGDRVLIWPIADHPEGGMDLFCRETFETGVPE